MDVPAIAAGCCFRAQSRSRDCAPAVQIARGNVRSARRRVVQLALCSSTRPGPRAAPSKPPSDPDLVLAQASSHDRSRFGHVDAYEIPGHVVENRAAMLPKHGRDLTKASS